MSNTDGGAWNARVWAAVEYETTSKNNDSQVGCKPPKAGGQALWPSLHRAYSH